MVEDPALPGTHLYPGFSLSAESAPVWWHRPFGLSGESAFSAGGQLLAHLATSLRPYFSGAVA